MRFGLGGGVMSITGDRMVWAGFRPHVGKSEAAKYETLVRRSLRHLDEGGETKPGDVRVSREELLAQLEILTNPDAFEHVLACHVADLLGLTFTDVRRLADLADLGSQYRADSRIPKSDLPRIRALPLRGLALDPRRVTWRELYDLAAAALVAGDPAAAGWHLERMNRRDDTAYFWSINLRLAHALATKMLEAFDERERRMLEEGRIVWGTTEMFLYYLDHVTILDPRAEPLVRRLLKRPKRKLRPLPVRKKSRSRSR
jgi:hypothetical protein